MKRVLLFILLFSSLLSFSQDQYSDSQISKPVLELIKQIAEENILMDSAVGGAGMRPKQYDRFEKLKNKATLKELRALTNHPNGVVRCYALQGLILKKENSDIFFSIIKKHLNDNEVIETFSGCIMDYELVSDVFLGYAQYPLTYEDEETIIDEKQIRELDSLLIYDGNKESRRRYIAIKNLPATPQNYPIVKSIAMNEDFESALVKLSEYHKEEDLDFLYNRYDSLNSKNYMVVYYEIAANYAHPKFFPLLSSTFKDQFDNNFLDRYETAKLYDAVASYKNKASLELLSIPFTDITDADKRREHLNYTEEAIVKYNDKIYDDLLRKLWSEYDILSHNGYAYLKNLYPEKTHVLSVKNLKKQGDSYIDKGLMTIIMDDIYKKEPKFIHSLVINGIEEDTTNKFFVYLDFAESKKDYVPSMLKRLEREADYHRFMSIVRVLIGFNDSKINRKILEIKKSNPNMDNIELNNLLDEHGIH